MTTLESGISSRFKSLKVTFTEKSRRLWAAAEALAVGNGGVMAVHRATSIARNTIYQGLKELADPEQLRNSSDRTRNAGGGRKRTVDVDPNLRSALEGLLEPITRGDPESPLRWTCRSLRNLAEALEKK